MGYIQASRNKLTDDVDKIMDLQKALTVLSVFILHQRMSPRIFQNRLRTRTIIFPDRQTCVLDLDCFVPAYSLFDFPPSIVEVELKVVWREFAPFWLRGFP